jgi:hypothetical protein
MSREFIPVCTNEEARDYFKNKGLTYDDIKEGDVGVLMILLEQEYRKSNTAGETSVNTMHLSKRVDIKRKPNGSIISCFLYTNSHYFTQRECISFNRDGFIGFAGWADDGNTNPIKRAFMRWCDALAEGKRDADIDVKEAIEEVTT